jgi:hypothetical protein
MVKGIGCRNTVYFVACVWTPDPNEELIFGGEIGGNVSLAFTPVLATNEYVNESFDASTVKAKVAGHSHKHVVFCTLGNIDHDVGDQRQPIDVAFSLVFP